MTVHTVHDRGWAAPAVAAPMPAPIDAADGLAVTDRALLRDGIPFVPVSGEIHYSRLPRERWGERLRQLRAAGITVASTYVFWLHHSPERGVARFDGNLDVAAFVDECAAAGLDIILRIGPWAHGEARNGGFPDWVQDADVHHRSDDPGYLELVREWFGQLAAALDGRAQPGGAVLGVQLENELYDRPDHLVTLKKLAREAGISAPLWTATAWGGAQLPDAEVFPLFGGYADGFWADPEDPWQPNFRAHFFSSHDWDDPGVGADVRDAQGFAAASVAADLHGFPPATCELGSGMATAYHRRPVLAAADIAALAHTKVGNGSAWQGYFMYVGGRNPAPRMQETQDTGYPNDMPELGYDFHAPIGQSGDLAPSAAPMRRQHAFLAAFGHLLGASSLPEVLPSGQDDCATLRWAFRGDGDTGFAFITHHQPYEPVADVPDVQLEVVRESGSVVFPSAPITVPSGTIARWPVGLDLAGVRVDWATASALTVLGGGHGAGDAGATLVLIEDAGVPVELSVDGVVQRVPPGLEPVRVGALDVIVLPADAPVWVREPDLGAAALSGRRLLLSDAELAWGRDGVFARSDGAAVSDGVAVPDGVAVSVYDPHARAWREVVAAGGDDSSAADSGADSVALSPELVREAVPGPRDYGFGGLRHRAPSREILDAHAAVYRLSLPADLGADAVLDIDWAGDVAELRVDGVAVDDRFWDGTRWSTSLADAGVTDTSDITLHVLPLAVGSTIALPAAATERLAAAGAASGDSLLVVDAVTLRRRAPWQPVAI